MQDSPMSRQKPDILYLRERSKSKRIAIRLKCYRFPGLNQRHALAVSPLCETGPKDLGLLA